MQKTVFFKKLLFEKFVCNKRQKMTFLAIYVVLRIVLPKKRKIINLSHSAVIIEKNKHTR